jgi:hypothetical protein
VFVFIGNKTNIHDWVVGPVGIGGGGAFIFD